MNVQFLRTDVVSDTSYIDLCMIDNQLVTFLMVKDSEPNNFIVKKQDNGDHVEDFKKAVDSE